MLRSREIFFSGLVRASRRLARYKPVVDGARQRGDGIAAGDDPKLAMPARFGGRAWLQRGFASDTPDIGLWENSISEGCQSLAGG
jgi:hypothetical protein